MTRRPGDLVEVRSRSQCAQGRASRTASHDVGTEKEFLERLKAAGATVRVLRTTAVVPTQVGGGAVLMRPAISIQYSFETRSTSGDERWVYRERWVADERGAVDLANALLTRITETKDHPIVMTQRSGSL